MTPLLWALVALLLIAGSVALIAAQVRRGQRRDNEVVAGVPSRAPVAWAGAHTEEARLHRRLRDAVRSLDALPPGSIDSYAGLRDSFEREALALDERLVAAAALKGVPRTAGIEQVRQGADTLEAAVAAVVTGNLPDDRTFTGEIGDVVERLRALSEARAELEDGDPSRPAPMLTGFQENGAVMPPTQDQQRPGTA